MAKDLKEIEKIMSAMKPDELANYIRTLKVTSKVCTAVGVTTIFLLLTAPSIGGAVATAIVLYIFGRLSINIDVFMGVANSMNQTGA